MEGFGLAGHKTTFSSHVLVGNWIEDKFGMEIAQRRKNQSNLCSLGNNYDTESSTQFSIHQLEDESKHPPSLSNSEVSYSLLFEHHNSGGPSDRFLSQTEAAGFHMKSRTAKCKQYSDEAVLQKLSENKSSSEYSRCYTTQSEPGQFQVIVPEGDADLPSFRRKSAI